jgi:heme-degrading monooxygenase HmoA
VYTQNLGSRTDWGFITIWEFCPWPGQEAVFIRAYGPDGIWVQLFQKEEGYIGTDLIQDLNNPRRFLTVDYWQSRAAYDRFRAHAVSDYEAIDRQCEGLNEKESALGAFARAAS